MKLIIEDSDIVQKINENLSPQIRVFGIERTNGSFSAYQFCDSRIYEYLIPTHAFLPPHPDSFLWKKLVELAEDARDSGGFESRQNEVSDFWNQAENQFIDPILEHLDPIGRSAVRKMLYDPDGKNIQKNGRTTGSRDLHNQATPTLGVATDIDINKSTNGKNDLSLASVTVEDTIDKTDNSLMILKDSNIFDVDRAERTKVSDLLEKNSLLQSTEQQESQPNLDLTLRKLKSAYIAARKAYRIHPARLARVRSVLSHYVGSKNYHNYTTNKSYRDASAKRIIKYFAVQQEPIIINDTEWLSLKVHGQSFMMHQIRKMVAMAALVVRCGCDEQTLEESYASDKISIPKAPGLGLLLERPVFDSYNERLAGRYARETLDFSKFEKEMEEFKQKEIYERIFREEERDNQYDSPSLTPHTVFHFMLTLLFWTKVSHVLLLD